MNKPLIISLLVIGILLIPVSLFVITKPYRLEPSKGEIEINWANPVGVKLNDLKKNDELTMTYISDINTSVYFITRDQAHHHRSPSIYKDPLPDPVMTGKNGSIDVTVLRDDDYEFLFLPEEPSRIFNVEYSLDRDLMREKQVYIFSGISIILTSLILIVLAIVLYIRKKK